MKRNAFRLASRPMRAALAIKIAFCFLAADVSLAAAKAMLTKHHQAAATAAAVAANETPTAVAQDASTPLCREVLVEVDEGYGLRGHVSRWVCRKAL